MGIGELANTLGVSDRILRRLAKIGVIPAKRLPTKRSHFRFAAADVESIRKVLLDAGVIEPSPKKK